MTITAPAQPDLYDQAVARIEKDQMYTGVSYAHENGARSFLLYDYEPTSPGEWDNLGTFVQTSSRYGDMDNDDEGLVEAWNHFANSRYDRETMMRRYLSIFRPEVLAFMHWYHYEGGSGIAYVTEERRQVMGKPAERCQEVLEAEWRPWRDYFDGNVLGVVAIIPKGAVTITDVTGSREIGSEYDEDACWGYYPDHDKPYGERYRYACEEIAGSPVKVEASPNRMI